MRAGWLLVAALSLVGAASPLWASPFAEVPSDHWAYRACARLSSLGVLPEDGQTGLAGGARVTRFEFGIALLDPLTALDRTLTSLPPGADSQDQLRSALRALRLSPRYSEQQIAGAFRDLRRLATEFRDVLAAMSFDADRVARSLSSLADEEAIRVWRLDSLVRPAQATSLRRGGPTEAVSADTLRLPLAHGTVGVSVSNPQAPPKLLDYLAASSAADHPADLPASIAAEASPTDPRVSRLRTSYEYGLGSALTLSLAYEEVARRGLGLTELDTASLTSIGIGYQLTRSASVKLSYSLLEYSNYALDTPPLRDRLAETAVSIEF